MENETMATTDQLRKAERRALNPVPQLNCFNRDGWCRVIIAMDLARFGEPKTLLTWRWTKADLRAHVANRIANGEPFPPRDAWLHPNYTANQ